MSSRKFTHDLRHWFSQNKRQFPWRTTSDPYRILIAELLLRKTTASQVERVYDRFVRKFPDPKHLAEATIASIEREIKSLGMQHGRAILLKRMGQVLLNEFNGVIPTSEKDLKRLPGVGQYAAYAVLNMGFGKREPLVDVNVLRILERVFGIKSDKKRARNDPRIWEVARELLEPGKAKVQNLAMLDFASAICIAGKPNCEKCFATKYCHFYQLQVAKNA